MPHGKCNFKVSWISNPMYRNWIAAVKNNTFFAPCKLCHKNFDISNVGECSLKNHMVSKKHKDILRKLENVEKIDLFFSTTVAVFNTQPTYFFYNPLSYLYPTMESEIL